MQLLINHLTRMQPGLICAAGIDLSSGRHVRPVVGQGLPVSLLAREGGPLVLGMVVDLGASSFCGAVPEIEDRHFAIDQLKPLKLFSAAALFEACQRIAHERLTDIFSEELEWIGHAPGRAGTAAIPQHCGIRSLGCYWAGRPRLLSVPHENRRRLRLAFDEGDRAFSVPVTDVRLYLPDHLTPDDRAVGQLEQALADASRVLLSIGLSRAYRSSENQPPRHWLQVNNFILPQLII